MAETSSTSNIAQPTLQHPRFAAFYEWSMQRGSMRRMVEPIRRSLVGRASGIVLEVGAGNGLNFQFYDPARCQRVEAIEPDQAMRNYAQKRLAEARVPIALTAASLEALPFEDQTFDSVVVTLVLCSVTDPEQGLREIKRVLKPGGALLLLEHVRSQGAFAARIQDAIVPLTTRLTGNCHWNRDSVQSIKDAGFSITQQRDLGGSLQPIVSLQAVLP